MFLIYTRGDRSYTETVALTNFRGMDRFAPGAVMHEDPPDPAVTRGQKMLEAFHQAHGEYENPFLDTMPDLQARAFLRRGNLYLGVSICNPYVGSVSQEPPDMDEGFARQLADHAGLNADLWRSFDQSGQIDYFVSFLRRHLNERPGVDAHISVTPEEVVCEVWMSEIEVFKDPDSFKGLIHSLAFFQAPAVRSPY